TWAERGAHWLSSIGVSRDFLKIKNFFSAGSKVVPKITNYLQISAIIYKYRHLSLKIANYLQLSTIIANLLLSLRDTLAGGTLRQAESKPALPGGPILFTPSQQAAEPRTKSSLDARPAPGDCAPHVDRPAAPQLLMYTSLQKCTGHRVFVLTPPGFIYILRP